MNQDYRTNDPADCRQIKSKGAATAPHCASVRSDAADTAAANSATPLVTPEAAPTNTAEADPEGWIKHDGGPMPAIESERKVSVCLGDGSTQDARPANCWLWEDHAAEDNIVSYKLA